MAPSNTISLLIQSRDDILFEGLIQSMTSYNDTGKFDILPDHANFISLINKSITIRPLEGDIKEIPIDNGVLRVIDNKIEIYLGVKK